MDVHRHVDRDADRERDLCRDSRANGAAEIYPVRLRFLYFGSPALFRAITDWLAGAAGVAWAGLLRLGHRVQSVPYCGFLAVTARSLPPSPTDTPLSFPFSPRS